MIGNATTNSNNNNYEFEFELKENVDIYSPEFEIGCYRW